MNMIITVTYDYNARKFSSSLPTILTKNNISPSMYKQTIDHCSLVWQKVPTTKKKMLIFLPILFISLAFGAAVCGLSYGISVLNTNSVALIILIVMLGLCCILFVASLAGLWLLSKYLWRKALKSSVEIMNIYLTSENMYYREWGLEFSFGLRRDVVDLGHYGVNDQMMPNLQIQVRNIGKENIIPPGSTVHISPFELSTTSSDNLSPLQNVN
jgi:hypothetical protein